MRISYWGTGGRFKVVFTEEKPPGELRYHMLCLA